MEAFEAEIVELIFPELFCKIEWETGTESLDKELSEIQKEIFDRQNNEKIISDKIIKVKLKDKGSKILFIHVEVQSYSSGNEVFGERMFRYFYRIWERFRYKYNDKSEIVAAAIYTYRGENGKHKKYVYKLPELAENIMEYNFRTLDVEKMGLENISDENPLKLVFKMGKRLLDTGAADEDIYSAKIELTKELQKYGGVKDREQIKALVDFLEYLFLIEDPKLENKYEEFKKSQGGVSKMSVDEIRKTYYTQKGREEEKENARLKDAERVLKLLKRKFNYSNGAFDEKIKKASSSELNLIIENILDIKALEDLNKYLILVIVIRKWLFYFHE
ncbi:MAG: DUF4351 domain-containing protein [Clostridium sp.]|uniref:Rpn family recombination-promoting nuclease/putative transposase n=1 Tax=Clostridium sp. TaxID=1506 RepID=UPI0025C19CA0|nr:Rpn family recombination-promoting nuclease/putative transposase [Clostridium sp.]MCH3964284.1 DUF4351 domain-containing protein [Clostridium sp.]MCI1715462.1 DUF4351 domain-containing protein [Clostridium sp.]MCI1799747.1 DUF4351 domain-containing protein [Clostridium sp.]MCI1813645.1 DUF4351 domain-containing protein [Clostridium sp.]MCI1870563.1 DUF4351 domain-containing protein [Clostridium sp.]